MGGRDTAFRRRETLLRCIFDGKCTIFVLSLQG
jgi:hypothetical protein